MSTHFDVALVSEKSWILISWISNVLLVHTEFFLDCWPERQWEIQCYRCHAVCLWVSVKDDSIQKGFSTDTQFRETFKCRKLHRQRLFSKNHRSGKSVNYAFYIEILDLNGFCLQAVFRVILFIFIHTLAYSVGELIFGLTPQKLDNKSDLKLFRNWYLFLSYPGKYTIISLILKKIKVESIMTSSNPINDIFEPLEKF